MCCLVRVFPGGGPMEGGGGGWEGLVVGGQKREGHEILFPNDCNTRTEQTALDTPKVPGT